MMVRTSWLAAAAAASAPKPANLVSMLPISHQLDTHLAIERWQNVG
jgi:hypothetical protein